MLEKKSAIILSLFWRKLFLFNDSTEMNLPAYWIESNDSLSSPKKYFAQVKKTRL